MEPTRTEKTTSADGTTIVFDRHGDGPPLVTAVGAFCDRNTLAPLARLLAAEFTVYCYDRRGRGGSGDTAPTGSDSYGVEREVEDLAAIVEVAGGAAALYGHSSGAGLALEAAARGVPVTALAAYEAPYAAQEQDRSDGLRDEITALVDAGDLRGAAKRFLGGAGMPPELLETAHEQPWWPPMEALAHTLPYDLAVMGDGDVPDRFAGITVPTLVLGGGASPDFFRAAVAAVAAVVPGARTRFLDGQTHEAAHDVLAPVLAEHFRRA